MNLLQIDDGYNGFMTQLMTARRKAGVDRGESASVAVLLFPQQEENCFIFIQNGGIWRCFYCFFLFLIADYFLNSMGYTG